MSLAAATATAARLLLVISFEFHLHLVLSSYARVLQSNVVILVHFRHYGLQVLSISFQRKCLKLLFFFPHPPVLGSFPTLWVWGCYISYPKSACLLLRLLPPPSASPIYAGRAPTSDCSPRSSAILPAELQAWIPARHPVRQTVLLSCQPSSKPGFLRPIFLKFCSKLKKWTP